MRISNILFGVAITLVLITLISCGQASRRVPTISTVEPQEAVEPVAVEQLEVTWPTGLPEDKVQPWEEVDAEGYVIPPERGGEHSASAINEDSDFTPGRERFDEAGDVSDLDEASRFSSGATGAEEVSYAIYEVALASAQPGAVSADVNLRLNGDSPSAYWLGLSDYGNNTWKWKGPFSDSHIRITVPAGDYTSGLGSFFICVVAYDGASFDLVGVGVNPRDDGDAEAPAAPSAPTLTSQNGGVLVEWIPVIADDLAGYHIHYADYEFVVHDDFGVERVNYLECGTRYLIAPASGTVFVALSAVDISGNESALSALSSADAGAGIAPTIQLTTDVVSGNRGISAQLTATGADTYDFDLDGDGDFDDLTGDPTGSANVNTDATGIIRPAVRGTDGAGGIAFAAVSLIIQVNSRPVAVAHAAPASGVVPLEVTFTGEGTDDDGTIDEYAWDFDGDGTYDVMEQNPPPHTYTVAGMYNAKLRVTDNDGAFDVDTVCIYATENLPPVADLEATPTSGGAPLTVNFDASGSSDPDGTIVKYEWDWEGDGTYDLDSGATPTAQHTFTSYGSYDATVRVTDDGGATDTESVTISVNAKPIADIQADPTEGTPPLTVNFDASGSSDPDGTIVKYEWDWEGDGIWDFYSGTDSTVSHEYTTAGEYTATVRVTDDGGATDTDSVTVTVGWVLITVDSAGTVGRYNSLAIVNGNPAISYYDDTNHDLKYVRASDANGGTWGTPIPLDSAGDVGRYTSLAIVNGYPAISYCHWSSQHLKYVRASDANGSNWGTPITVDSAGFTGEYTSLAVLNGNPAISYYDNLNKDLKYVRADDPNGGTWGTPITVDSGGDVGYYTSLTEVNGNPAISYYDATNDDLKYVRANNPDGSSWGTPITVDSAGYVGGYTSLAVVSGNPAISYYDWTNVELKYVRADDIDGSSWGTPITPDSAGSVGEYTSLAIVNGYPAISYWDSTNDDLKYVRADDANGGTWGTPVTVDSAGVVGSYTSLAIVNGNPAISYWDNPNGDLKFAIPRLD